MLQRRSREDKIFDIFNYSLLTIVVLVVIYPLYYILIGSFTDPDVLYKGGIYLIPHNFTFEGYARIFQDNSIWYGYKNTFLYTVLGTILNVCITVPGAYSLSRKDLEGRKIIMLGITFTMLFNGGLIPTFILVQNIHIYNTFWAMILPTAVNVWNLIVARTFFEMTIPGELLEASTMDGCSNARFFTSIVLPLSSSLIAVMVLFYAVLQWNGFFNALIFLQDEKLFPLQLVLRNILLANQVSDASLTDLTTVARQQRVADLIKYGAIIIASVPLLILYPFLQKYFVKGVMIGAIKG